MQSTSAQLPPDYLLVHTPNTSQAARSSAPFLLECIRAFCGKLGHLQPSGRMKAHVGMKLAARYIDAQGHVHIKHCECRSLPGVVRVLVTDLHVIFLLTLDDRVASRLRGHP
jgi:hypothetical protein